MFFFFLFFKTTYQSQRTNNRNRLLTRNWRNWLRRLSRRTYRSISNRPPAVSLLGSPIYGTRPCSCSAICSMTCLPTCKVASLAVWWCTWWDALWSGSSPRLQNQLSSIKRIWSHCSNEIRSSISFRSSKGCPSQRLCRSRERWR